MASKTPKWLEEQDTPQKKGRRFESKVRQTIASGAFWFDPEDLDYAEKNCICQLKATDKNSFSVSYKTLRNLFVNGLHSEKSPILIVRIKDLILIGKVEKDPTKSGVEKEE